MIDRKQAVEIILLARQVFDFDDWKVIETKKGVVLYPVARPEQRLAYSNLQDCIDDLRFRALVRFTRFEQHA